LEGEPDRAVEPQRAPAWSSRVIVLSAQTITEQHEGARAVDAGCQAAHRLAERPSSSKPLASTIAGLVIPRGRIQAWHAVEHDQAAEP